MHSTKTSLWKKRSTFERRNSFKEMCVCSRNLEADPSLVRSTQGWQVILSKDHADRRVFLGLILKQVNLTLVVSKTSGTGKRKLDIFNKIQPTMNDQCSQTPSTAWKKRDKKSWFHLKS